jgi:hypothetical protein
MAQIIKISGMPNVLKNLNASVGRVSRGITRGLIKGGLHLQAKSLAICPKQKGALKASSFTRNVGGHGYDADVVVGYTADYAIPVHEILSNAHGKEFNIKHAAEIQAAVGTPLGTAEGGMFLRGENEQAKFLEKPAREERMTIIQIVATEALKP